MILYGFAMARQGDVRVCDGPVWEVYGLAIVRYVSEMMVF